MAKNHRVCISKTKREWKVIDKRINELGTKSFNRYLNKKISSLIEDYNKCPEAIHDFLIGEKPVRQKSITPEVNKVLLKISVDTKLPVSTIVDRIIITPLLIEK